MRLGYSAGHVGSNTAARGLSGTKAESNKIILDLMLIKPHYLFLKPHQTGKTSENGIFLLDC